MQREKITITLRKDLIRRVDQSIDGDTIRNRSHAIEYFLNQTLKPRVQTALIVAGEPDVKQRGSGKKIFVPFMPFEGKPFIEHQISLLADHGINKIFILLDDSDKKIKEYVGDGRRFGVSVTYENQVDDKIGTGYALRLAKSFLAGETFVMIYCNVFAQIDLEDFAHSHFNSNSTASIALTSIEDPTLYGVAKMKGGRITEFLEKPKGKNDISRVISSGIFCFGPQIFEYITDKKLLSLERDIFPRIASEKKLGGYMFEGKWCNIKNSICYGDAKKINKADLPK